MKKILGFAAVLVALALIGCAVPVETFDGANGRWAVSTDDRAAPIRVDGVPSGRTNASNNGFKITSNSHSDAFPGFYFLFDRKDKDQGYLRVDAETFAEYKSFTLTAKNANLYTDYVITKPDFDAPYYVFLINEIQGKNINMVWLSEFVLNPPVIPPADPIVVDLGFIGHYLHDGRVLTTSFYWQRLNEGDLIDWAAVEAAYAGWVAEGGLAPDTTGGWRSSGFAPIFFADGAAIGHGDFSFDQLEGYYRAYFVATGYTLPYVCADICEGCGVCLECGECECYVCDDICEGCGVCLDCGDCECVVTPPPAVVNKGCQNCEGQRAADRCDGSGRLPNGRRCAQN